MTLESVDLHTTDEDELAGIIDDACDHDKSFTFVDSNDLDNPTKPLAVLLPWALYCKLAHVEKVEPHLGKATQTP